MNHTRTSPPRLLAWGAIVLSAFLGVALATVPSAGALGTTPHAHPGATAVATPRVARSDIHDQMRKLWEDHITWTRLAIVTFADGSPGFGPTADRLLQNQSDIGDAVAPFYGRAAGDQLTALLRDHITIAVELLQAARAEDTEAFHAARIRVRQRQRHRRLPLRRESPLLAGRPHARRHEAAPRPDPGRGRR